MIIIDMDVLNLCPSFYIGANISVVILFEIESCEDSLKQIRFPYYQFLSCKVSIEIDTACIICFQIFMQDTIMSDYTNALQRCGVRIGIKSLEVKLCSFSYIIIDTIVHNFLLVKVDTINFCIIKLFDVYGEVHLLHGNLCSSVHEQI